MAHSPGQRVRIGEPRRVDDEEREADPTAGAAPADVVLRMQRTQGNQAVQRMLGQAAPTAEPVLARDKTKTKPKVTDWPGEFKKAAKSGEWRTAAMVCWVLSDDQMRRLLDPLSDSDLDSLEAEAQGAIGFLLPGLAGKVHRHVSFQKHAPAKPAKGKEVKVEDEGTLEHEAKVGGGKVSVRMGGETENLSSGLESDERFWLVYKGKEASKTSWLQFIWREMEVDDPVKGKFRVDQAITTTGGSYRLTTDPSKPNYNTDSADPDNPFYEAAGISNRTSDATTIFDLPSPMQSIVKAQLDAGATKVVSRAHFTTYLVREMNVLYEVNIDVEWEFTSAAVPPRKQSVSKAGNASALDPAMRARLIQQYPNFDYLP
jgi:hypothetical protein